jgi:hypothetical protein
VRRLALVCLLGASGCSLLFDPEGVVGPLHDLGAPDLPRSSDVDDLAAPLDLAVSPDDLTPSDSLPSDLAPPRDLLTPDLLPCVPPNFLGFFDGGSPDPLDCNQCGCELDSLENAAAWPLKFTHPALYAGWSEAPDDGGHTILAPAPNNGEIDYFHSKDKFYLDGDFDLTLDYQVLAQPQGGYLLMLVEGAPTDGGFVPIDPFGYAQEIQSTTSYSQWVDFTDDRFLYIDTNATAGTLRVRRSGNKLCASTMGQQEGCHTGTGAARVWVQFQAQVSNGGCSSRCTNDCCNFRVHWSHLRLRHGSVVSQP